MSRPIRLRTVLFVTGVSILVGASCGGARPKYQEPEDQGGSNSNGGATATGGSASVSGGTTAVAEQTGGTSSTSGGTVAMANGGVAGTLIEIQPAWDYTGIVGTGQSLSVGNLPITSKTQPYHNLMLSLGTATVPPWDSELAELSLVPLVELKNNSGYPAPYPLNRWGETPHSAMANELTTLVRYSADHGFISVHTVVGESGQGMIALKKLAGDTTGKTGRAYAASLFEVGAIARLAKAAGKTYGIGAILMTHGETDSGSSTYESELIQLASDYNTDLSALTGQTTKFPMLLSQQFAYPSGAGQKPVATQVQWRLGVDHPDEFICTGPKYQYPGHGDGVHLATKGYQMLGEKTAQVYFERVLLKHDWKPLEPESVSRDGRVITVTFHVPVPPLVWDESFSDPTTSWTNAKGFEVRSSNSDYPITSVEIVDNSVKITCGADLPASNLVVGYAMTSGGTQMTTASKAYRWGKLRDSDPFVGYTTNTPQPNYCVAFNMPVP